MDDLSPGARSLLQAADLYDDPSAEDATRVRRAVLSRVGAIGLTAAVVAVSSTQAKAASVMSIAAKLTAVLAVTAGGVAATYSYANHVKQPLAIMASAPMKAPVQAALRAKPAAEPAVVETEPVKPEETAPAAKRVWRAPRVEPVEKAEAKPEPTPADLEAEMKLIRGADTALRSGRAGDALSLLAQHQAEHPRAALAHEREGLRAIAQCQLGAPGSSATAERFIAQAPRSPLAPRLRSACRISE